MKIWPFVAAAALVAFLARRRRHLEPPLLVGGALVAIGLCVYGSGLVKLPNLEELLLHIGNTLGQWTYLLVAVLAFLETGAFVGLLAPGETAMILGGVVAGQGEISVITLIALVWVAATLGDAVSFWLGRRLGRDFLVRHGPKFRITPEVLERVEGFFDQHGGKAILLGRFVGIVRAVAPFLAGTGRMSFKRFLPYDILGAGLWATTFILLGYVFWQSLGTVLDYAKKGALGLGITITVIVGLVVAVRWLSREENRHELAQRMDRAVDRPGLRFLRPAVRWVQGPLRFFIARLTPGELGLELTTLLAIAAVGSFAYFGYWLAVAERGYGALDLTVNTWAVDLYNGTVATVAEVVTVLGAPALMWPLVGVVTILLLVRRHWVEGAVLGAGMLLTIGFVRLGKSVLERPRPADAVIDVSGYSFPSGHAAYAVAWIALAVIAVRLVPSLRGRWWLVGVAIAVAVIVALTRVYLRVHWLSDVLAGAGVAAMSFSLVAVVALVVDFVRHNPPQVLKNDGQ
ncbi:MAG: bifunctional DedA family/phosphatase PAP2 family protein [Acidobacteria bacterium]|nr:bifunctional DedA family/phosphatase PAP2 family protein [Acidobacteriota bacterium]